MVLFKARFSSVQHVLKMEHYDRYGRPSLATVSTMRCLCARRHEEANFPTSTRRIQCKHQTSTRIRASKQTRLTWTMYVKNVFINSMIFYSHRINTLCQDCCIFSRKYQNYHGIRDCALFFASLMAHASFGQCPRLLRT